MYSLDIRFWSFHTLHIQNLSNCCRHNFNPSISRIFSSKFQQVHLTSVSSHSMHFTFKICQTAAGITLTSQFHKFFLNLILAGFFFYPAQLCLGLNALATNCVRYFETVVRTTPTYATMILCPLSSTITVTSNASRPIHSRNMLQPLIG